VTGRNGAAWQVAAVRHARASRPDDALRAMLAEYRERMHSNVPVHEWSWPGLVPAPRPSGE